MDKWIEMCRKHIVEQVEALGNNRFNLRVPSFSKHIKYTIGMHYHTTPEMSSQISGTHTMKFIEQSIQPVPGDITIIPAMLPHFGVELKNESTLFMVIGFEHGELSFIKGEGKAGEIAHSTEILIMKTQKKEIIKNYINHICEISKIKHRARKSTLRGILLACFSELLMILDEDESTENYHPHSKISKAQRLVVANLGNAHLNVDFLSRLIPCSPGYLSQLFRRKIGIKLNTYINEKRLEYSKRLLKETNMNISEIAYSSGYSDPSYFICVFRQQTGMTPLAYRQH